MVSLYSKDGLILRKIFENCVVEILKNIFAVPVLYPNQGRKNIILRHLGRSSCAP